MRIAIPILLSVVILTTTALARMPDATTHRPGCHSMKCDAHIDRFVSHLAHMLKHHHECKTLRCADHANKAWNRHQAKIRKRREAREAREAAKRGWVIPEYVVMCESSGENLSPNYAGAAGYYQIMPETWSSYGGSPPDDASQHSKAEQDAVASRIWDGGNGASQWVCA